MSQVHGLRWVPTAAIRPHKCAAIPFIGQSGNGKGFFDTGTDYFNDRVYISVVAAEQMAQALGWHSPAAGREWGKRETALKAQVDRLTSDLAAADAELDAVEVIQTRRQAKRPARKPDREEAA